MAYKVVPFKADLTAGEQTGKAAQQLEALMNDLLRQGWAFESLEALEAVVTTPATPGTNGCLGIGAVPGTSERRDSTHIYVAVFRKS